MFVTLHVSWGDLKLLIEQMDEHTLNQQVIIKDDHLQRFRPVSIITKSNSTQNSIRSNTVVLQLEDNTFVGIGDKF
jgi:hypothetical protein